MIESILILKHFNRSIDYLFAEDNYNRVTKKWVIF